MVVHTSNGELQLLSPPDTFAYGKTEDAAIPANSLLQAQLRAQSIVTAMVTVAAVDRDGSPVNDGTFWVFATGLDKSIRRLRVNTEAHKAAAAKLVQQSKASAVPAQNFQVGSNLMTVDHDSTA